METGIHIGASKEVISELSKTIMQILGMAGTNEQATIQKALDVLTEIPRAPESITISGNTFGHITDIKPEAYERLKASWAEVTADESGKVEVSKVEKVKGSNYYVSKRGVHPAAPKVPAKKRPKRK